MKQSIPLKGSAGPWKVWDFQKYNSFNIKEKILIFIFTEIKIVLLLNVMWWFVMLGNFYLIGAISIHIQERSISLEA